MDEVGTADVWIWDFFGHFQYMGKQTAIANHPFALYHFFQLKIGANSNLRLSFMNQELHDIFITSTLEIVYTTSGYTIGQNKM